VSAVTSEPVVEKVNHSYFGVGALRYHEVQGRLEGREALLPLSRFSWFDDGEAFVLRMPPTRRDRLLFLVVVLVGVEANHDERAVAGVGEQLHDSSVLTRTDVRLVLVLIHFYHENIRAHVHENVWPAPGAPVGDALVKRDREVWVTRANEIGD